MSEQSDNQRGRDELIRDAERRGLWLRSPYQNLWFSPQELRDQNAKGSFCWGPLNFELRDPQEMVRALEREIEGKKQALDNFIARVAKSREGR